MYVYTYIYIYIYVYIIMTTYIYIYIYMMDTAPSDARTPCGSAARPIPKLSDMWNLRDFLVKRSSLV